MATTFEKVFNMKGFDKDKNPRWQMVPVGGDRYMALRNGAGLTVTSDTPGVVTVTEIAVATLPSGGQRMPLQASDRIFKLHGCSKGNAKIQAKNGAALVVELEVDTKNRKDVTLTFNFVKDSAGHHTTRVAASARNWVSSMNYIYNGQANVFLTLHQTRTLNVPSDLGTEVTWTAGAASEWNTVTGMGDPGAQMNYYLVWEYEQGGATDTDAGTLTGHCIFEDHAGSQIGETMAHELGHHLGAADHYDAARKNHLMHGITDERGIHLPKEDVNTMNP